MSLTNDEARALGERWIKAGGGWRAGMLVLVAGDHFRWSLDGLRVEEDPDRPGRIGREMGPHGESWWAVPDEGHAPDLRDPATRGAALDVVRERWGGTVWIGGRLTAQRRLVWWVCGLHRSDEARVNGEHGFGSEAEALVAALEAGAP